MVAVSKAYVGMGANLGDRIQNLIDARQQLRVLAECVSLRCSSLYLSSPVGYDDQPDFINCVLEVDFADSAGALFTVMQRIETSMGRQRELNNRNAARIIDLDLLLFGDLRSDDATLTIPHPRIAQRLFVLQPLIELNSQLALPGLGKLTTVVEQGHQHGVFTDQSVHRLGS